MTAKKTRAEFEGFDGALVAALEQCPEREEPLAEPLERLDDGAPPLAVAIVRAHAHHEPEDPDLGWRMLDAYVGDTEGTLRPSPSGCPSTRPWSGPS